jgi:hypothetical protein
LETPIDAFSILIVWIFPTRTLRLPGAFVTTKKIDTKPYLQLLVVNFATGINSFAIPILEYKKDIADTGTNSTYCLDWYKMGKNIFTLGKSKI